MTPLSSRNRFSTEPEPPRFDVCYQSRITGGQGKLKGEFSERGAHLVRSLMEAGHPGVEFWVEPREESPEVGVIVAAMDEMNATLADNNRRLEEHLKTLRAIVDQTKPTAGGKSDERDGL